MAVHSNEKPLCLEKLLRAIGNIASRKRSHLRLNQDKPNMARIVWYHFSDLHFRSGDAFDRERVLSSLWEDLRGQIHQIWLSTLL